MTLYFMCVQNKIWSEITGCTLFCFTRLRYIFMLARDFEGDMSFPGLPLMHTVFVILTCDAVTIVRMVLLIWRTAVSVGLDSKECNVFIVLHYAGPAEQRDESKSGICAFVWVENVGDSMKYTWSSTYDRLPFWLTGHKSIWSYVGHIFINRVF
jgi:hypothetical protein